MNKILITTLVLGLLLVASVSAYICVDLQNDNEQVQIFKQKINQLSVEEDIKNDMPLESISLKLKYFSPCKR